MVEHITNQTVWGMDFAARERRQAIASVPVMRPRKERDLAPGLSARGVWGNDVSGMDSRSVKRSLRGFGGARTMWWKAASFALAALDTGSMEHTMYRFHRSHHAVTFLMLEMQHDFISMLTKVVRTVATIRAGTGRIGT
jgi:hypothetical protein